MKKLVTLLVLLFALQAKAQDGRRAFVIFDKQIDKEQSLSDSREKMRLKYLEERNTKQRLQNKQHLLNGDSGGGGLLANGQDIGLTTNNSQKHSSYASVSKTVNCTAGQLSSLLTATELSSVTDLTITGTIDARDFKTMRDDMPLLSILNINEVDIVEYTGPEGTSGASSLTYPNNTIPDNSFWNIETSTRKETLTSIILPASITAIGMNAFANCVNLSGSLAIPSKVKIIGQSAFENCPNLTGALNIPSSVESIGNWAFWNCKGFTGSLIIPSSVTSIGKSAFCRCSGFTGSLTIPNSITSIEQSTFWGCTGLNGTLTLSANLNSIGDYSFSGCQGFTGSLVIPNTVISIGNSAFKGCTNFNGSITLGESITSIGDWAFDECRGFIGSLILPNTVTHIGDHAFYNCSGFNGALTLGSSITTIGQGSFSNCTGFSGSLSIPSSVVTIGDFAFCNCKGFNGNLSLGSKISTIGEFAFSDCTNFTGSLTIPNSVKKILGDAFSDCKGFNGNLTIGSMVDSIGNYAFFSCTGFIGSLSFPSSVNYIGEFAFTNCSGFDGNLVMGNSIKKIGLCSFFNCQNLQGDVVIPNTITIIDTSTFRECHKLNTIKLPQTVTSIKAWAFAACGALITVDGNNPMYSSADGVLFNKQKSMLINFPSSKVGDYSIPNTVTTICKGAFWRSKLNNINIPSSVQFIDYNPFQANNGLIVVDASNVNYSSKDGVLFNKGLTELISCPVSKSNAYTIPSTVKILREVSFICCSKLTTITIPSSIEKIDTLSFSDCNGLKSIYICSSTPIDLKIRTGIFWGVDIEKCTLYVPIGSKSAYQAAEQWKDFTNIVEFNGFALSSSTETLLSTSGLIPINIISDGSWTASSNQPWLTVSPNSGSGNTSITLNAEANNTANERTAIVTVLATGLPSQFITVTQQAGSATLSVSTTTLTIGSDANSTVTVGIISNTSWNATSNQAWLTVGQTSGFGGTNLTLTAEANNTVAERTAIVTVSATGLPSQVVTVTQQAGSAILSVSTTSLTIGKDANSTTTLGITSNTTWNAASNQAWLTVGQPSGSGNVNLTLTAEANPTTLERAATVTVSAEGVSDQVVTVTQQAGSATLSVSTTSLTIGKEANSTATVDVTSNTSWSVSSDQVWLTVNPSSGNGDATLIFTAEANALTTTRRATVTVSAMGANSQTVIVTQEAGTGTDVGTENDNALTLYPNPVTDGFYINGLEGKAILYLYDSDGRLLIQKELIDKEYIPINRLSTGMYFIKLKTESDVLVYKKLIKN